jgi:hypothetical protein
MINVQFGLSSRATVFSSEPSPFCSFEWDTIWRMQALHKLILYYSYQFLWKMGNNFVSYFKINLAKIANIGHFRHVVKIDFLTSGDEIFIPFDVNDKCCNSTFDSRKLLYCRLLHIKRRIKKVSQCSTEVCSRKIFFTHGQHFRPVDELPASG